MLIEDLQVIVKVAKFRSITAAATTLNMRPATASAAVKRVEKQLGTELFIRTTRHLRLSSAGERYIPHCQQVLSVLEHARHEVQEELDIVDGELRIAVSSDLGRNLVIPWLDQFMEEHPGVSLRVNVSDSNIDFYRDAVDIALRYGSPNDANLYGFKICNVPRLLCATQQYIDRAGMLESPHDLTRLNGLFYQLYDIPYDVWEFSQGDQDYTIKMTGDRTSNDGDLVRRWCVAGKGVALKSCLDMATDLLAGNVISLIPSFKPAPTELWMICPSRQLITPAFRLLRDFITGKCLMIHHQLAAHGLIEVDVLR